MNKYTLIKEKDPDNKFDCTKVTIEVETEDRQEIINSFIEFLGGCGFNVDDLREEWYN